MIAILTSKTTHHIFFENQIFKKYKDIINIYETTSIKPKFQIASKFEKKERSLKKEFVFRIKNQILKEKVMLSKISMTILFLKS